jgi:outer membrane protein assembly factor BamB
VGSFDGGLYAFNAAGCGHSTCSPLWIGSTGPFIASTPSIANGLVYIGDGDSLFYAFKASGCGSANCAPLWTGQAVGGQAAINASPTIANGLVYVGENNGMMMVFDANGCGSSFCFPLIQLLTLNEEIVSSSAAVVNGSVYFGSANQQAPPIGRLYVFRPLR